MPIFAEQFKNPSNALVEPQGTHVYAMKIPLFLKLLTLQGMRRGKETLRLLRSSSDIIWSRHDPSTLYGEIFSFGEFLLLSKKLGVSANESTSYDLDYNGRDESL